MFEFDEEREYAWLQYLDDNGYLCPLPPPSVHTPHVCACEHRAYVFASDGGAYVCAGCGGVVVFDSDEDVSK